MRSLLSANAQLALEQLERLVVGLDEPLEQKLAAECVPCWFPSCWEASLARPRGPLGHLTAGGRGPRITCIHPSVSSVLHPLENTLSLHQLT